MVDACCVNMAGVLRIRGIAKPAVIGSSRSSSGVARLSFLGCTAALLRTCASPLCPKLHKKQIEFSQCSFARCTLQALRFCLCSSLYSRYVLTLLLGDDAHPCPGHRTGLPCLSGWVLSRPERHSRQTDAEGTYLASTHPHIPHSCRHSITSMSFYSLPHSCSQKLHSSLP